MKTKTIVIAGCSGIMLIALIAVAVVVGIFFLGVSSMADKMESEGTEYGMNADQQTCLDESLSRLNKTKKSGNTLKQREVQMFIYGCFQTSRESANFCSDMPKDNSFFTVRRWADDQCQRRGLSDVRSCESVFIEVSNSCFGVTPRKAR
jgi:hypothetical protein